MENRWWHYTQAPNRRQPFELGFVDIEAGRRPLGRALPELPAKAITCLCGSSASCKKTRCFSVLFHAPKNGTAFPKSALRTLQLHVAKTLRSNKATLLRPDRRALAGRNHSELPEEPLRVKTQRWTLRRAPDRGETGFEGNPLADRRIHPTDRGSAARYFRIEEAGRRVPAQWCGSDRDSGRPYCSRIFDADVFRPCPNHQFSVRLAGARLDAVICIWRMLFDHNLSLWR